MAVPSLSLRHSRKGECVLNFEKTCKRCREQNLGQQEPAASILVRQTGFAPLKLADGQFVIDEDAPLRESAIEEDTDVAGLVMVACKHGHQFRTRLTDDDFVEVETPREEANVTPHLSQTKRPIVTGPKAS